MKRYWITAAIITIGMYIAQSNEHREEVEEYKSTIDSLYSIVDESQRQTSEVIAARKQDLFHFEEAAQRYKDSINLQIHIIEEYRRQIEIMQNLLIQKSNTIYDIPLDTELQTVVFEQCEEYGINGQEDLVLALMQQESNYKPDVISSTGDYGLMQINEVNHDYLREKLGVTDFLDPEQNIQSGVYLLSKLFHKYDGNLHKTLMSYNMGEAKMREHWNAGTYSSRYSRSVLEKREQIVPATSAE